MITDLLLLFFYPIVWGFDILLQALGPAELPEQLDVVLSSNYLSVVAQIIDINLLAILVGFILTFELGVLTLKLVNWLIRKIPTIS